MRDADSIETRPHVRQKYADALWKFAALCHQPSQLFVIRDISFSDPLLKFSFIQARNQGGARGAFAPPHRPQRSAF